MTPHLNPHDCLKMVQMRGHNIWFQLEIIKNIPHLSSNIPLIWSFGYIRDRNLGKNIAVIQGFQRVCAIFLVSCNLRHLPRITDIILCNAP